MKRLKDGESVLDIYISESEEWFSGLVEIQAKDGDVSVIFFDMKDIERDEETRLMARNFVRISMELKKRINNMIK